MYLPDYEIKQWDETNWNVNCCDYVAEAYEAKKWAFVSDYARFDILYKEGGIYFDTDVELIRPIDDLVSKGPFMGFETDYGLNEEGTVAPGLGLAAYPGLSFYKRVINSYRSDSFILDNGTYNLSTVVARVTGLLKQSGLKSASGVQVVEGIYIYPSEYFNPKDYHSGLVRATSNTRSIHHFSMSWLDSANRREHDISAFLIRHGLSRSMSQSIAKYLSVLLCMDFRRVLRKIKKQMETK